MRITASTVLTPDGPIANAAVTTDGDRIVSIDRVTGSVPRRIVAPGFVDLQVNGVDDVDVPSADEHGLARIDALLLRQGTTAWCPTIVTRPLGQYRRPIERLTDADEQLSTTVLGVHLEGPFLGGAAGAHDRQAVLAEGHAWLAAQPESVRLVTLAPELVGVAATIRKLVERRVLVSLGHSLADAATSTAAIDAGARLATHVFNAMGPLHHREPGLVGVALSDDRIAASIIPDLVHVHPAVLRIVFRAKGPRRVVTVTDAVARTRPGAVDLSLVDGAPRMADGTLAGSALTMDQAIRNLVGEVGIPLADAVHSASTTPADRIGAIDRGRIEPRCKADLVVLGADDLEVTHTFVGGEVVHEA